MNLWSVLFFIVGLLIEHLLSLFFSINFVVTLIMSIGIILISIVILVLHKYKPRLFGEKCAYCVLAIIFNEDLSKVVMVKNKKQNNRMLPAGGHVRKGEKLNEAVSEIVYKETGLTCDFALKKFHDFSNNICKTVPQPFAVQIEQQDKIEGHVEHYDFVYIMKVKENESSFIDETKYNAKWYDFDEITDLVNARTTYQDVYDSIITAKRYLESINATSEEK